MNIWRYLFSRPKQPVDPNERLFRCGTPHLQSGGIVLLHTGNVVEILRGYPAPKDDPR